MSGPAPPRFEVIGVTGIGEITAGDRLGETIVSAARSQGTAIEDGDLLVVTQKVVSKAEGRLVDLRDIEPSPLASELASTSGRDPRLVEVVLRESRSIVRTDPDRGIIICETMHGFVCANAGVDTSNVPGEWMVSLLPEDPDRSARKIVHDIAEAAGADVGVVISDTHGRAWREGLTNLAIGVAGLSPILDYKGTTDMSGQVLSVTAIAVADELAATAELVMGKATGVPAAIIRGYAFPAGPGDTSDLVRNRATDLFR
ncbi:MAG: coenzyme F420-0:L-glutamate ligase [Chloroflexi bacterium]|nr:coenzyme F420-0:L-glutamate ligase [Chloroflexota bacterium]